MSRLEATGDPVPVVDGIGATSEGIGRFAIGSDGTLVYAQPGDTFGQLLTLALVDRTGTVERLPVPPNAYLAPRLSPDGRRLAFQTDGERSVIWTYDLSGNTAIRRLTLEGNNVRPICTPDGSFLTFASDRDGEFSIYRQRADGSGVMERLTTAEEGTAHWPETWSPDGSTLAFRVEGSFAGPSPRAVTRVGASTAVAGSVDNEHDLWVLSPQAGGEPRVLSAAPFPSIEMGGSFSPDGRWFAYASGNGQSLEMDVYVEPFPPTGEKHAISTGGGGLMPLWSRAGDELFYRPLTNSPALWQTLKSIDVSTDPTFRFSSERTLALGEFVSFSFYRSFDVTPNGQRFLVVLPADETAFTEPTTEITVVLNWFEELKERVPVP